MEKSISTESVFSVVTRTIITVKSVLGFQNQFKMLDTTIICS